MTSQPSNHTQNNRRVIRDTRGRRLILVEQLGVGSFGRVYCAEDEESGEKFAAKLPLSEEELGEQAITALELCLKAIRDVGTQLKKLPEGTATRAYGIVDGGMAVPCLLEEYFEDNLLERLRAGMNFSELCLALAMVCEALTPIHDAGLVHANLKPGNIFFVQLEEGAYEVRFSDPASSTYLKGVSLLTHRTPGLAGWIPPEADGEGPLTSSVDVYTVARVLFEAVVFPDGWRDIHGGVGTLGSLTLDKNDLLRFKSGLAQRLLEQESNPHVRDKLVQRATAFLTRALAVETAPSPPYRFYSAKEAAIRLREIQELFHPGFEQLGMILLEDPSNTAHVFQAGDEVRFWLSFRCQGGISDIDLIHCMTYVRDLNSNEKVKDAGIEVAPQFDGSRFRFGFRMKAPSAGKYLIRVALGVKGSPGKPIPRDLTIDVQGEARQEQPRATSRGEVGRRAETPSTGHAGTEKRPETPAQSSRPLPSTKPDARVERPVERQASLPDAPEASTRKSESSRAPLKPVRPETRLPTAPPADWSAGARGAGEKAGRGDSDADSSSREAFKQAPPIDVSTGPSRGRDLVWMAKEDAAPASRVKKSPELKELRDLDEVPDSDTDSDSRAQNRPPARVTPLRAGRDVAPGGPASRKGHDLDDGLEELPVETPEKGRRGASQTRAGELAGNNRGQQRGVQSGHDAGSDSSGRRGHSPEPRDAGRSRQGRAPERSESRAEGRGKPGEQFKPELYYSEARDKALPGEDSDNFFERGALSTRQYVALIAVLAVILLGLVGLILWLMV